jgi:hypothetical protein
MQVQRHALDVVKDRVHRCAATLVQRHSDGSGKQGIRRTTSRGLAENLIFRARKSSANDRRLRIKSRRAPMTTYEAAEYKDHSAAVRLRLNEVFP